MTDTATRGPRKPLVPGPSGLSSMAPAENRGIAAQAIALRESQREASNPAPAHRVEAALAPRRPAPVWPITQVGEIAKGITGVMAEVGSIKKSGFNKFHNYHYATLQDLLEAVCPLMGKHGIAVIQNEVERSMVEGNRVTVTYEFSIFHTSGEVWPEHPRFTGMCMARDSKGNVDDKAINKCHSHARKYFLLSLFQVPSGDFDDADEDQRVPDRQVGKSAVPGPSGPASRPDAKQQAADQAQKASEQALEKGIPHKIVAAPGTGADQWASKFISAIAKSKTADEVKEWDKLNDAFLQRLSDGYPGVYDQINAVVQQALQNLAAVDAEAVMAGMPDPKENAGEAMNWIATELQRFNTYEEGEAFWNQQVAPHEKGFDQVDWEMLLAEWGRFEQRVKPEDPPPEAA